MYVKLSENISKNNSSQIWPLFFIILVFCFFIFIFGIGLWDLWNPDEPRYAEVAREMVERGDWVLMHLNGKIYGDKPPVFFWLIAFSSFIWNGFNSFAVRFPSALFGTLTVIVTFLLGKILFSEHTGFLSSIILITCVEFAYLSTRANIDTTLTFFTTTSILFFYQWLIYIKEDKNKKKIKNLLIYGFYVSMALATLTKGPVGFIVTIMVSITYLLIQKDWKSLREMRLFPGMLLFLMIVLSWYIPAVIKGGNAYLKETLFKHTVEAYVKGWTHVKPPYYYLINFPIDFLPWFLFMPGAIIYSFLKIREGNRKEYIFLLIWFFSVFLFFSFSKGKRPIYLLPLYPAASLLVGKFWNDYLLNSNRFERLFSIPIKLLSLILIISGSVIIVILYKNFLPVGSFVTKYLHFVPRFSIIPLALSLLTSGILLKLKRITKYKTVSFILIALIFGGGFFYTTRIIFPLVNPYKSARFFSQEIKQALRPGEKLAIFGGFGTGPYNFYTGIIPIIELNSEEELIKFFSSKERVFCLLKFNDYERVKKENILIPFNLISDRRIGGDHIALLSNQ
ncbi:MAG: ArnT family glycosyltransferase [Candidatus Jordarchaeum sp.]